MNPFLLFSKVILAVCLTSLLISPGLAQQFDCYEGQGVLENGWQDWSWCTHDFHSTAHTLQGSFSIQVDFASAWQGLSLHSMNDFQAGYFSAISFSINGGENAGRSIQMVVVANGQNSPAIDINPYIEGGGVAAGAWKTVTVPLAAFGLNANSRISRFWLQDSSGHSQPSFWIDGLTWVPKASSGGATISIDAKRSLRTVDPKMFGINIATWDGNFSSSTCQSLLNAGGYKAFRYPGGSLSDEYHWATNTTLANTWTWATNFDSFATSTVPITGGEGFITVNYGTGTAAEAAAWVNYSNVVKNYGMKYWEIGNECFGNWETDTHTRAHDPVIYAQQFALYYQQMKAVDPSIKIGAVATTLEDDFSNYADETATNPRTGVRHHGWTPVMLATLVQLGITPDYLIYHRYPEYITDCDFTLLAGNSTWPTDVANMRQMVTDYLGSSGANCQIQCTENNCDSSGGGKQMTSLVNGLFLADTFGTILQTECNSFMWWDFLNGQQNNGDLSPWLYGWRQYGDFGAVSPDFTQTYPVYYVEQILNLFAKPGDRVLPVMSSEQLVSSFAVRDADGTMRLMLVNKNPTATYTMTVKINGFSSNKFATVYTYGMSNDNAARNGQPQTIKSVQLRCLPTLTRLALAPYSVSVVVFTPVP